MNKVDFLLELTEKLSPLPWEEVEKSRDYYTEMIDDRMEDGLREEEAVAAVGNPAEIAAQILTEVPLGRLVKAKLKPRHSLRVWEIVLLVLGAPLWVPLLAAVLAVLLALYVSIWTVVLSLYAANLALAVAAVAGMVGAVSDVAHGGMATGAFLFGSGLVLAGLAIFTFLGCNQAARGALWLGKLTLRGIRFCMIGKGAAK